MVSDEEVAELPAGKSIYKCTECKRYFIDSCREDEEAKKKGYRRMLFRTVKLAKHLETAVRLMNPEVELSVCDPCMLGEFDGKD